MGYSNETVHYGIPLPTGSDLTTPMDYNESMTDVDVAVFEAKTDSSSALSKAGQLETALDNTNQNVSAIDGRLTEAEGTIVSQGQAITNLNNKIVDLGQDVEDAICSVVEETATAEYNHAVGDYFWYNNTLYITTVAITAGDTIVPNTNCDTVTVATELVKLETEIEAITPSQLSYIGYSTGASPYSGDLSGYNEIVVITVPNRDASNKTFYTDTVPVALFSGSGKIQDNILLDHLVSSDGTMATRTTVSATGVTVASQGSTTLACGAYIYGR